MITPRADREGPSMTVRRNETDAFRLADSRIYVGISAWTEPTLIESGRFYPCDAKTPETRLRYYATEFPIIEIDSTFYAPPSERIAQIWADRTPSGFIFDVKSYRLLTHHPTAPSSLWRELRDELAPTLRAKANIYASDLRWEFLAEVLDRGELTNRRSLRRAVRERGKQRERALALVLEQCPSFRSSQHGPILGRSKCVV